MGKLGHERSCKSQQEHPFLARRWRWDLGWGPSDQNVPRTLRFFFPLRIRVPLSDCNYTRVVCWKMFSPGAYCCRLVVFGKRRKTFQLLRLPLRRHVSADISIVFRWRERTGEKESGEQEQTWGSGLERQRERVGKLTRKSGRGGELERGTMYYKKGARERYVKLRFRYNGRFSSYRSA